MALTTAVSTSKRQIHSSLETWRGSLEVEDLPLFRAFAEETLSRLRAPFLAHHPPLQVVLYLEQAFQFARQRTPGTPKVSIRRRSAKGIAVFSCMDDQPFIVDTVRLFLRHHLAAFWGGFNLIFSATRDAEGRLLTVGEGGPMESLVMLEADAGQLGDDLEGSTRALADDLLLAKAMVRDFKPMVQVVERYADRAEALAKDRPDQAEALQETAAFLRWLLRENFVFMGLDDGVTPLGFQTVDGPYFGTSEGEWPPPQAPGTVRTRKGHVESPVHRAGRIDEVMITLDVVEPGSPTLFIRGMFTYRAITQPSRNVPILRRLLASILEEQRTVPGSFRHKGIANVFDSLPTELLFATTRDAIAEMVELVFESEQQQEVGVTFLMTGQDSAFCLVAMPKTQFSDELRRALQEEVVQTLDASHCDHGVFVGRYDTVLLHYYLTGVTFPGESRIETLTERIRQLATPWLARLWHALATKYTEEEADRLADTYGRAFPESWTRSTPVERAVLDMQHLERLSDTRRAVADVFTHGDQDLLLRLYEVEEIYLTDILPVLGDFGLTVKDAYGTAVHSRRGQMHIDTFRIGGTDNITADDILRNKPLLVEGLQAVFQGLVSDDPLNALVLSSGLDWREVDLIRGYARYGRQLQITLSEPRVQEILLSHPSLCRCLVTLFHARFDPDLSGDRGTKMAEAEQAVHDELRLIHSHDEDLTFSSLLTLICATVRTNFYRTDRRGYYVSFKLDGSKVRAMRPNPPTFETYVHSKEVEGVHMRFGMVARGGLRWSDRDDFRTEVRGLASTQQVKNVVIVPQGAKGGFYLKHPSRDPRIRRQEADLHYQTFIRGLLDLTDNSVDGQLVKPPRVFCHDGEDAYLVVAADKGTAHLSDTANALSKEYGFWLGDAFASGGSVGYDHKKVGITARGAWKLVQRHFAEVGVDPYSEPFTVIGVGDMSGDVFGNGLSETPWARLLAAFNHLHIFLDPDPDDRAHAERLRLFKSQGGWDQYDRSILSEGGGIYDRRAKSIPLSPQAQAMLELDQSEAAPETVIRHILKMQVDLLWNGGIGTYVKASTESHAEADDRSNYAIRIDGAALRAKVVGEGGNLGFTQRGRIEAALHGVRINTDAIDNSGGVDMSDHEVNLKILLGQVMAQGALQPAARDALLREMTEEVAELVFASNDAHGRQLSRDQIRSRQDIFQFGRAIHFIESHFNRDRSELQLPSGAELQRRAELGEGLTRPELAVISGWVKMYVFEALIAADPKQIPGYDELLFSYFPERIQREYPDAIRSHMLADEIAMTVATTRMIADAGAAFFPMTIETTAATVPDIATAYFMAQRLAKAAEVRSTLEELRTSVSLTGLYRAWVMVDGGAREVARYWLSTSGRIPTDEELQEMMSAADEVYALQASEVIARNRSLVDALRVDDIPEEVALRILKSQYLNIALMIWAEAKKSGTPFTQMVVRHLAIARASRLQDVLDDLGSRPASGHWDPMALRILHNRFHNLLRVLVGTTPLSQAPLSVDQLVPDLAQGALRDVRHQVDSLLADDSSPEVATLLVLEERVASAIKRLSPG